MRRFGTSRRDFVVRNVAALASIGLVAVPARAAQFEFKAASNQSLDHPVSVRLRQMWASIERESSGRLRTQFFPNSMLGSDASMFSQLRLGAIQFLVSTPALGSVAPATDITNIGFAFKDEADAMRVAEGPLGGFVRDEIEAKGIHALRSSWDGGMREVGSAPHPTRGPDDLHGIKIKVVGRLSIDLFKRLGAIPIELSIADTYTGLQTKLVDAVDSPLVTIQTARLYEVLHYLSLTNHTWSGYWLIANGEMWKSLPPDLQTVVERNNTRYSKLAQRDAETFRASLIDKFTRQGLTVNRADQAPFRASLKAYYDTWASSFGSTAWGLLETSIGRKLG